MNIDGRCWTGGAEGSWKDSGSSAGRQQLILSEILAGFV